MTTSDTAMHRRTLLRSVGALGVAAVTTVFAATTVAKPRVIEVVAKKFDFVPAEIHVRQGEAVTLLITAPEVPMGFNLADFGVRADVVPGKVARIDVTPDKAGRFTFLCDVFCGSGHEDMSGVMVVT